jgi:cytochrome c oxidase subunit III
MSQEQLTADAGHDAVAEESPYGIPSRKLAMWLFILADAATFGVILIVYGFLRVGSPDWTKPFAFSPTIVNGFVMTVVLLTSSLTMVGAVTSAGAGRTSASLRWLAATIALGVVFAALHLHEWFGMFGEGWRLGHNPLGGAAAVGATFFSITGLHLLHVIGGIIAIGVVALAFRRGRLAAAHIETVGLYWHFVDLVWMFVFPLVYLMNAR